MHPCFRSIGQVKELCLYVNENRGLISGSPATRQCWEATKLNWVILCRFKTHVTHCDLVRWNLSGIWMAREVTLWCLGRWWNVRCKIMSPTVRPSKAEAIKACLFAGFLPWHVHWGLHGQRIVQLEKYILSNCQAHVLWYLFCCVPIPRLCLISNIAWPLGMQLTLWPRANRTP